jgi:hypothetical protein
MVKPPYSWGFLFLIFYRKEKTFAKNGKKARLF